MAVEYKKFLAELQKLETEVSSAFSERKTVGDSEGNSKKLLDGARLAIGDRVGELRAKGLPVGKEKNFVIADFAADPEVHQALEVAKESIKNFTTMEDRKIKNHEVIKSIYNKYVDLGKRVDAEIASRSKKIFEPGSLPDMKKLAAKIHTELDETGGLKDESIKDAAAKATPKVGGFGAAFATAVQIEINKSAGIRANAAVGELTEKFKSRLLKLRGDRVNTLATESEAACVAATTAKKAGNVALAKAQLKIAEDKSIEMSGIAHDYSDAYNKNKTYVMQNPDHDAIFKTISTMTATTNRVLKAVSTAQTAVG